jgi:hypothetical protein
VREQGKTKMNMAGEGEAARNGEERRFYIRFFFFSKKIYI